MRYDLLDLSKVPPPDSVVVPDFDVSYAQWIADFQAQAAVYGVTYNVGTLASDPIGWVFRVGAYRGDIYLRQRVNDGILAVLLPTATKGDLDNVVSDFNLVRRTLVAADPTTGAAAVMESDDDLRARRVLAPEALTTAGSYGAYRFHCLEAHPDVLDVGVYGPEYDFVDPGKVRLVVLSAIGNGVPTTQVLLAIAAKLNAWEAPDIDGYIKPTPTQLDDDLLRPDTDHVIVQAVTITNYTVSGVLRVPPGADDGVLVANAKARIAAYATQRRLVGARITRDSLIAAGRQLADDGTSAVLGFSLTTPNADVDPGPQGAAYMTADPAITVEVGDG